MLAKKILCPVLLLSWALSLSACSYPISKDWRRAAESTLSIDRVIETPDAFIGYTVIWGGIISQTLSHAEGSEITIMYGPLDPSGKPNPQITEGTFIAQTSRYLTPGTYQKGMGVILAGEILAVRQESWGMMKIPCPVVQIKELHLWQKNWYPAFHGWTLGFHEASPGPLRENPDSLRNVRR
jgi:starvation-inducible outer membrane lipoprotein